MGWPNKTSNRNKEKIIKLAQFKETRRQTGIQKKHSTGQKRSKKKTKTFLGQIRYKFGKRNIQDSTQSVQNFKTN
jgi:hypothetical protein